VERERVNALVTPGCPLCGQQPVMILGGGTQAFCGNDDCTLLLWNPSLSLDENLLDAGLVRFPEDRRNS
jgi:hypothetical protein